MKKICMGIIFLVLLLTTTTAYAAKRALLIGINDYKALPSPHPYKHSDLRACVNDVQIMKDQLVFKYGFASDQIKVLTDKNASKANIMNAFRNWLIKGTKAGDVVLFYFSGHGSQVDDMNGDEEDGKDEVLCPYDVDPDNGRNIILDDELGVLLRDLDKREVIVIIDACHSGTATRGGGLPTLEQTPAWKLKYLPINFTSGTAVKLFPKQCDNPPDQVLIAASRENQIAMELFIDEKNDFYSALTYSLYKGLKGLADGDRNGYITYEELFKYAEKIMKDNLRVPHDPQIEPPSGEKLTQVVFSYSPGKPEVPPSPTTPPTEELPPPPSPEVESAPVTAPSSPELPSESEIERNRLLVAVEDFKGCSDTTMKNIRSEISRLPYVQIVDQASFRFDRLIRGQLANGKFSARVINRIGDSFKISTVDDINQLIDALAPHLEYAYIVKQLAYITHPYPPFKVRVWLSDERRRDFRLGEKIVFNFYSEEDCYLLMLNLDSKGNFQVIYPNRYHTNNFVRAGEVIEIPDERMRRNGFELMFGPPAGEETVKVIATAERLDLQRLGLERFEELFQTFSGSARAGSSHSRSLIRGVLIMLREGNYKWSEDSVVVRSYE